MVWKWSTGKVLVADSSTFTVNHISFNPWDGTQLVAVGDSELNHLDFVEEELKLKADTLLHHVGPACVSEHASLLNLLLQQTHQSDCLALSTQRATLAPLQPRHTTQTHTANQPVHLNCYC